MISATSGWSWCAPKLAGRTVRTLAGRTYRDQDAWPAACGLQFHAAPRFGRDSANVGCRLASPHGDERTADDITEVRRVHNFAGWERSKLEKLTELQSRTIEGLGMLLAAPAPPEAKVAEADALVRHFQELKDTLVGPGTGSRDAAK